MNNGAGIKSAFCISLLSHFLLLGVKVSPQRSEENTIPQEIALHLEVEEPGVLPRIDILAEEKRFKPQTSPHLSQSWPEESFLPGEKKEISDVESSGPGPQTEDFSQEESLRYQDMVKQRIEAQRIYPAWARRQAIEGIAVVSFRVLASGQAGGIRLIHSSGSGLLDQETINTIKRASPFPAIPKVIGADSIAMEVALVFSLGQDRNRL